MNWKSGFEVSNLLFRASVGITMVLIGISAYRDFAPFVANVTDGLGWARTIGHIWAFILPALFVFGGGLLVIGRYSFITALTGGLALASIPVGLMLKNTIGGVPLPDMISAAYPPIVLLMAFYLAINALPERETPHPQEDVHS